ncbi:uncharacterized protein DS421_17g587950 [Arachis hypogaea]|nr:uncharacterized protein DS421_17g587950 [Arachis hypogaea]
MIEQRKKERGSQIDGGTTTKSASLGYLAIMLFCKSEDSYRGIEKTQLAYTPWVASAALQVKGLLQWFASQVKGLLREALPTGKPYLMEAGVPFRILLMTVLQRGICSSLNPVYETPVVWLLDEVPERRHMAMPDRVEE